MENARSVTAEEAVEILNRALSRDRVAVSQILLARVPCNADLADDETVQVRVTDDHCSLSAFGLIKEIQVTGEWRDPGPDQSSNSNS